MNKYCFFLPTRKGSERVENKNTRPFAGNNGGLLHLKIKQLLEVPDIPIILSTNDEESIQVAKQFADDRIKIIERPEYLCLSSTKLTDFVSYVPQIVGFDHIIWVHVTEPFIDKSCFTNAISEYENHVLRSKTYDSLMSCNKIQTFIWDKELNDFLSHDSKQVRWPRSQDIKPIYEINSAIFINSRENYIKFKDRIGDKPYLFELNKLQSIDIDWEDDFKMAELLYAAINKI